MTKFTTTEITKLIDMLKWEMVNVHPTAPDDLFNSRNVEKCELCQIPNFFYKIFAGNGEKIVSAICI